MNNYEQFAWYYDSLMEPQFYVDYFHYIMTHATFENVLELGCGTGRLAGMLAKRQKFVTGIDLSEDMIAIAKEEHTDKYLHFEVGDMITYHDKQKYDLVLCLCDSLNYVLGFENQVKVLKNAYDALAENGTLIFDIHSPYKIQTLFHDYHEEQDDEDFYFYWSVKQTGEYEITHYIVIEDLNNDVRLEEKHIQQSFEPQRYKKALSKLGFTHIETDENFQKQERIVFIAKK